MMTQPRSTLSRVMHRGLAQSQRDRRIARALLVQSGKETPPAFLISHNLLFEVRYNYGLTNFCIFFAFSLNNFYAFLGFNFDWHKPDGVFPSLHRGSFFVSSSRFTVWSTRNKISRNHFRIIHRGYSGIVYNRNT